MDYNLALLLVFGGAGTLFFLVLFANEYLQRVRIREIDRLPFSESYETIIAKTPYYPRLTPKDRERIRRSILRFIHTKEFVGIHLRITDEIKVLIAFYACLLLMRKQTENCYDNLKTIIVYPHAVMIDEVKSYGGIYTKERFVIQGQSADETVVITWNEAKKESYHMRHNNVIIHEFAHEIDFMDGQIDGIPPIEHSKYDGWVHTFEHEFQTLNNIAIKNRGWGKYKLLGAYAASNEAEFFAVVTERFFETPGSLKHHFPELYEELREFYRIDTAEMFSG